MPVEAIWSYRRLKVIVGIHPSALCNLTLVEESFGPFLLANFPVMVRCCARMLDSIVCELHFVALLFRIVMVPFKNTNCI